MKIKAKLLGTLIKNFPGHNFPDPIVVEIPDGASVGDLLAQLEISKSQMVIVSMGGRILRGDDKLQDNSLVRVFQAVHGG